MRIEQIEIETTSETYNMAEIINTTYTGITGCVVFCADVYACFGECVYACFGECVCMYMLRCKLFYVWTR